MTLQLNDLLDFGVENGSSIRGAIPLGKGGEERRRRDDEETILHRQPFALGVSRDTVYALLQRWPDFELETDINVLSSKMIEEVHYNTWMGMAWAAEIKWEQVTHIHIFTDGSYLDADALKAFLSEGEAEESAAWSFVVVAEQVDISGYVEYSFLGFMGEQLKVGEHDGWIGTAGIQSLDAECAGLTWGALWWLQSGLWETGIAATLWVDCIAAGLVGCGGATLHDYPEMHSVVRSVIHLAQCTSRLSVQHCKGHAGQPWNELADIVAKDHASLGVSLGCALPRHPLRGFEFQAETLEWAWLHLCRQDYSDALPELQHSGEMDVTSCGYDVDKLVDNYDGGRTEISNLAQEQVHMTLDWTVATSNVLSLKANEGKRAQDGLLIAGRVATMQRHLEEMYMLLFGVQEARSSRGQTCGDSWGRIRSGCTNKSGLGCELWYGKYRPYATIRHGKKDEELFFEKQDFTVMYQDERRLLVALRTKHLRLDMYVGHSPHSGATATEAGDWWKQTSNILRRRRHTDVDVVFFFDANGKLGSAVSPAVGACWPNDENRNGWHFHSLVQEFRAFVPSTFPEMQDGNREDSGTWTGKQGDRHRIDYVALPAIWKRGAVRSWVDRNIELLQKAEDHRPACVSVVVHMEEAPRREEGQWRTRDRIDRRKLKTEEGKTRVAERIKLEPQVTWATNVHEHAQHVVGKLRGIIEEECPKDKCSKRKDFIEDETWEVMKQRKRVRMQLVWAEKEQRRVKLRSGLARWKTRCFPYLQSPGDQRRYREATKSTQFMRAWWARYLGISRRVVIKMLRLDRDRYLDGLAQQAVKCDTPSKKAEIYSKIKFLRGATARRKPQLMVQPSPSMEGTDGYMCSSYEERQLTLQEHFARQEAAEPGDIAGSLRACAVRQQMRAKSGNLPIIFKENIPSLQTLEKCMRHGKTNRGTGLDAVPDELYALLPAETAQYVYPLLLKMHATCSEPFAFKGGWQAAIWKGRGTFDSKTSFRQVLLEDCLAKKFRRAHRDMLVKAAKDFFMPLQCGGRKGFGTDIASHTAMIFSKITKNIGVSAGKLYIDIVAAYYTTIRQLIVQDASCTHSWKDIVARFKVNEQAAEHLVQLLDMTTAMQEMGANEHLQCLTVEVLTDTWFVMPGSDQVSCTMRGTRPGDPIADLLFCIALVPIVKRMKEGLDSFEDYVHLSWDGKRSATLSNSHHEEEVMLDVSLADDLVLMAIADDPEKLEGRMQKLAARMYDTLLEHGFEVNLEAGKSEVVMAFRGRGAMSCKRKIHIEQLSRISFESKYEGTCHINVTFEYKHLGTWTNEEGSMRQAIIEGIAKAKAALRPIQQKVLGNPNFKLRTRSDLTTSLILSRMLFNAHIWHQLRRGESNMAETGVIEIYRRVTGQVTSQHKQQHFGNNQVLVTLHASPASELLSMARLRYFRRLILQGPAETWSLLKTELAWKGSWLEMIHEDLRWMKKLLPEELPEEDPEKGAEIWSTHICAKKRWKKTVARAAEMSKMYRRNDQQVEDWQESFWKRMEQAGLRRVHEEKDKEISKNWACDVCGQRFHTLQQVAAHQFDKHRIRNDARRYARTTHCEVCLMEYHSRTRLVRHLAYTATGCYDQMVQRMHPLNDEQVELAEKEEAGRLRKARHSGRQHARHRMPNVRLLGPLRPSQNVRELLQPDVQQVTQEVPDEGLEQPREPLRPVQNSTELNEDIMSEIEAAELNEAFRETVIEDSRWHEEDGMCYENVRRNLFRLLNFDAAKVRQLQIFNDTLDDLTGAWDGNVDRVILVTQAVASVLESFKDVRPRVDRTHAEMRAQETEPTDELFGQKIPQKTYNAPRCKVIDEDGNEIVVECSGAAMIFDFMPFARTCYIVVHVYSGRRRYQDLQSCLEMITSHEDFDLIVISLDLAVSYEQCDMTSDKNREFWRGQIYSGRIIAAAIGAPCEIYSAAREQAIAGSPKAPRPLRSRLQPWGLPGLRKREVNQVYLSNVLMSFAIDAAVALVHTKGMCVSEHPAAPRSPTAASKWRLTEVQALLCSPAACLVTFNQSLHGAPSPKPTTLLAVRLPTLKKYIYKAQTELDPLRQQHGASIGVDAATGAFKTAKLKEYPSSMSLAIAKAMYDNIKCHYKQTRTDRSQQDLCALSQCNDLSPFMVKHDAYECEGQMLQDYMQLNKSSEWA